MVRCSPFGDDASPSHAPHTESGLLLVFLGLLFRSGLFHRLWLLNYFRQFRGQLERDLEAEVLGRGAVEGLEVLEPEGARIRVVVRLRGKLRRRAAAEEPRVG